MAGSNSLRSKGRIQISHLQKILDVGTIESGVMKELRTATYSRRGPMTLRNSLCLMREVTLSYAISFRRKAMPDMADRIIIILRALKRWADAELARH